MNFARSQSMKMPSPSPIGMGEGNFPKQADQMCVSLLPSPTCGRGKGEGPFVRFVFYVLCDIGSYYGTATDDRLRRL
jgi:hypothetical protein